LKGIFVFTMPPLNRFLEDQENNVWRNHNPSPDNARRGSFNAVDESPLKPTNVEQETPTSERRARFSEQNQIQSTIGRGDYSEQEIDDCWCTASEFVSFRQDIFTTLYLHKTEKHRIDGEEYTMRGVEHRVEGASSRRSSLRSRAKSAVLDEQDFQDGLGEASMDDIAAAYSRVANDAVFDVLNLAALDRLDAFRYQNEISYEEFFNDDWISSISTTDVDSSSSGGTHGTDMSFLEDASGFDDSWLRDILVKA
jgi:hypothetical protein